MSPPAHQSTTTRRGPKLFSAVGSPPQTLATKPLLHNQPFPLPPPPASTSALHSPHVPLSYPARPGKMSSEVAKVAVPESVLRKQKREEQWAVEKKEKALAEKKKSIKSRKLIFTRAKQYAKEYDAQEKELVQLKREARLKGGFYVSPEVKLLFVVRIRGYPNLKSVRELIYKMGYGKLNKQRIPLSNNQVIEAGLGKHNIICIEDLVHEIMIVGPHFKEANNFLWPFKLKAPLGGLKKKRNHYVEGGDAGNRENYINELIKRMN
ncbi:hypothetical protein BDA96_06G225500 [Sorghum bicolor]|uniref:Large ribosomal subunit protein uL30 N-terminal eukaryotes domain-containing protein n=1 Tax=Sorghum bicolor TaxID=4558 RepID=A0A921QV72_SORBI|nr:hypothetical protein BDA96_06G225500 [Sorghum bicolor]